MWWIITFLLTVLPTYAHGKFFSVEIATVECNKAGQVVELLPENLKIFIKKEQNVCKIKESIFSDRKKAEKRKEYLKIYGIYKTKISPTLISELDYLFKDEDYEEYFHLLKDIKKELLDAKTLFKIGISAIKIGYLTTAQEYLEKASRMKYKKATERLLKLYYTTGKYRKVTELAELNNYEFSESALKFVVKSYMKTGHRRKATALIKNKMSKKASQKFLSYKYRFKITPSIGYDSNPYLASENAPLVGKERKDTFQKVSIRLSRNNMIRSQHLSILTKRFDDISNRKLNFTYVSFENKEKLSDTLTVFLPKVSYIYTLEKNYSSAIQAGVSRRTGNFFLSLYPGVERNYYNRDKDNIQINLFASIFKLRFFLTYKDYDDYNNKLYTDVSRKFTINMTENTIIYATPSVKYIKYA